MKTIEDIRKEYDRLDTLCGVNTKGIELRISKQSKKRGGYCRIREIKNRWHPIEIVISAFVLNEDEELFLNVIRHEYAHALVCIRTNKNNGHNALWKRACAEVGCDANRFYTASESILSEQRKTAKYELKCEKCGNILYWFREGKNVKAMKKGVLKLTHPKCGGKSFTVTSLISGEIWRV